MFNPQGSICVSTWCVMASGKAATVSVIEMWSVWLNCGNLDLLSQCVLQYNVPTLIVVTLTRISRHRATYHMFSGFWTVDVISGHHLSVTWHNRLDLLHSDHQDMNMDSVCRRPMKSLEVTLELAVLFCTGLKCTTLQLEELSSSSSRQTCRCEDQRSPSWKKKKSL